MLCAFCVLSDPTACCLMNWMKNTSLETLIQASLNLVKTYQQRFWPKASKYPNSPENPGFYSDSRHAILNPDCFQFIKSVKWRGEMLLVFPTVSLRQGTTFVPFKRKSILYLTNPLSSPVSLVMVWTNTPKFSSLVHSQQEDSPSV